jgi:NTE family protein
MQLDDFAVNTRATLRQWLEQGPFTLVLSSGFFGFYAHTGMLSALLEAGFAPARVAGCSAGALVGGAWAAGVEPLALRERLMTLERSTFWDPAWGPGLLRGARFREILEALLPVRTFAECRVPLTVSVFDVLAMRTLSCDAGELAPAIQASCTVPIMFHPVRDAGRVLVDGGLFDRPGIASVSLGTRVLYHHLPSRLPWAPLRSVLRRNAPQRAELVSLTLDMLPKSNPFQLELGRRALAEARRETSRALDCPIEAGSVRLA